MLNIGKNDFTSIGLYEYLSFSKHPATLNWSFDWFETHLHNTALCVISIAETVLQLKVNKWYIEQPYPTSK